MRDFVVPKGKDYYFTIKVLELESFTPQDMVSMSSATMVFSHTSDGTPVTNGTDPIVATGVKVPVKVSIPTIETTVIPGVTTSTTTTEGSRWSGTTWLPEEPFSSAFSLLSNVEETIDGKIYIYYSASEPTAGKYGDYWIDLSDTTAFGGTACTVYRYEGPLGTNEGLELSWRVSVNAQAEELGVGNKYYIDIVPETVNYVGYYVMIYSATEPNNITTNGDWWLRTVTTTSTSVDTSTTTTTYTEINSYLNGLIKFLLPASLNVADTNLGLLVDRGEKVDSYYLKSLYFGTIEVTFTDPLIPTRFVIVDKIYVTHAG